jgi:hypothetical protein
MKIILGKSELFFPNYFSLSIATRSLNNWWKIGRKGGKIILNISPANYDPIKMMVIFKFFWERRIYML